MDCLLCQKHAGLAILPPGGYIYHDEHWMVCHAPLEKGSLGTLTCQQGEAERLVVTLKEPLIR